MLKIYGVSDDLVEIESDAMQDEIDCFGKSAKIVVGYPEAKQQLDSQGVIVIMTYSPEYLSNGCWTAEISPISEEVPIPWEVNVKLGGRGYSSEVTINCPSDIPVKYEKIKK